MSAQLPFRPPPEREETKHKRTSHYHHRRLWLEALENRTLLASGVGVFAPD
jgi:hypothetical protein